MRLMNSCGPIWRSNHTGKGYPSYVDADGRVTPKFLELVHLNC